MFNFIKTKYFTGNIYLFILKKFVSAMYTFPGLYSALLCKAIVNVYPESFLFIISI